MKKKIIVIFMLVGFISSSFAITLTTGINYEFSGTTSSDEKYNGPGFNIGALLNIDFFMDLEFRLNFLQRCLILKFKRIN